MLAVRLVVALLGSFSLLLCPGILLAGEYRLQVANLYRDSFAHFIEGPIGTGNGELPMPQLQRALDSGDINEGALLSDRLFRYGWDALVRSFGAVKVRGFIKAGEAGRPWDEAVWEGKPGERSVWVIGPLATNQQEVYQVALNGKAEDSVLRYYIPYRVTGHPEPQRVVGYPLVFTQFYTDRGNLWSQYLTRSVSLDQGLAAVIGINDNASFADWVYLIVEHPPHPATFKAVIGWERRRTSDRPGFGNWNR